MKLYSESKNYKLFEGNMLDMLDVIEPNSIDAIVTDPPYELNFMNKGWDNSGIAFQKETWEKCLKVLKPGGYLLAFGGSRTFHRIACAIEDAGFEIRDTIMWMYGCYSADTQVLTNMGWKYFYDLDKTEQILQWDKDTNKLSWCKPLNYFEYDVDDELCLFENRHISQLVTKNHKVACQIKARRKTFSEYQLVEAQNIKPSWILNFPLAGKLDGTIHEDDAYILGWWLTDAWAHKDGKAIMFSQSKPKTLDKLRGYLDSHNIKYSEYIKRAKSEKHRDEHIFYVTGDIANKMLSLYPNRKLNWDMLNWDTESRKALLDGLMDGDGSYRNGQYAMTFWSMDAERLDIFQALCISLNYRAYVRKDSKWCVEFNVNHNSTQVQTRHHKPNVTYAGKVYCLQTETGAFVVRRNGKAFISGNSGFPKSMNIGLAIDKKNGVESKVIGHSTNGTGAQPNKLNNHTHGDTGIGYADGSGREFDIKQAQNEWAGWGTQLKPAYEPIIVSRKPCEGSCVDNVMKYGVGGINIDECRVPTDDVLTHGGNLGVNSGDTRIGKALGMFQEGTPNTFEQNPNGRFPANVILTYDDTDKDEVCGGMPYTKSTGGSGEASKVNTFSNTYNGGWGHDKNCANLGGLGDEGSAARYFYCAKASKRDRDEGLPKGQHNIHPTLKPLSLMQYLIRLVTPKGGILLDPFNGSGSTGKACMWENKERSANYKYIGIELTPEYLPISKARIEYVEQADSIQELEIKSKSAMKSTTNNTFTGIKLFDIPQGDYIK